MNPNHYKLVILLCVASLAITGSNFSAEQKVETLVKANPDIDKASADLRIVRSDSTELAQYKIKSEIKLRENELLIADMKDKMNSEKYDGIAHYEKQLDSLAGLNSQLRNDIRMFSSESKTK